MEVKNRIAKTSVLPLLALRGLVIFPEAVMHFDVGRNQSLLALNEAMGKDQQIFLVTQKDITNDEPDPDGLYSIGVVARVRQVLKLPNDAIRVLVEGLYRAKIQSFVQNEPFQAVKVMECPKISMQKNTMLSNAMLRQCRKVFEEYMSYAPRISSDAISGVAGCDNVGQLADYIAYRIQLDHEEKQRLLTILSPRKRMEQLIAFMERECEIMSIEKEVHDRVHENINQNQRDYYLREQMKFISQELGEGDNPQDEAQEFKEAIIALKLDPESEKKLLDECKKLSNMPSGSHEATVVRGYIETCLSLPWNRYTEDVFDLSLAKKRLDKEHYGMDKVKDRMLELLAVRKLAPDIKGQIICLAGPPGVGKTSIAKAIAQAMGRKYVRISLGGTRDESDIRGHRRTYIGAMPGRIINALKQAGTCNPVILLDEIDKMGNDFRGDPSSAMLEVLDSEQNMAFRDHYIEIPYDLSRIVFITTANDIGAIPRPLYDRMEIVELPSYTAEEKFQIAKQHLVKKQVRRHGMKLRQVRFEDTVLRNIIDGYTRESGVRELERQITKICRKCARIFAENAVTASMVKVNLLKMTEFLGPKRYKDDILVDNEVGAVNGLAWTSVGGEVMPIEVAVLDGTGKIELTGSLGDVMKESAKTAVSYVRSRAKELCIDAEFYKNKDIHIHALEGAVPKDGPSAGVTIATAMVSALTGIPVRSDVAMTGEISLRGKVLPIGGLREKSMAAYRRRMKTVLIPAGNESDLSEIDAVVKENINFVTAAHLDTVIQVALDMYTAGDNTDCKLIMPVIPISPSAGGEAIVRQ